jgi:hypothetical protein
LAEMSGSSVKLHLDRVGWMVENPSDGKLK